MSSIGFQPPTQRSNYAIATETGPDSREPRDSAPSPAGSGGCDSTESADNGLAPVPSGFPGSPAEPSPLGKLSDDYGGDEIGPANGHNPSHADSAGALEKHPLKLGVLSGDWTGGTDRAGKKQNSVDLHVTGKLGQSIDKQDLIAYLKTARALIQSHHEKTGTPGELEWHPTGAVVTKGAVQLLSETLGGPLNKAAARSYAILRKNIWSRGQQPRNNKADRIDKDIQPEYFAYLNALKGVQGVSITPITKNREKVAGFDQLSEEDQAKAFDHNMLENSDWGNQRFKQYVDEYKADSDFVPSLRIKIDQQHIPALISTLEKQGK